jgi:hypothetical protein
MAEQCHLGTTEQLCKQFAEPAGGSAKATRFEPVTDEDRKLWDEFKRYPGEDITVLVCHRLGYMQCSMGDCRR